ncbi:hypothetical protein [Croceibacter atlanticus]|uniref:hypothetical protein n=1 Tax=Croceibacter atlanticus TaxID=313588 RepID=UPI0030F8E754
MKHYKALQSPIVLICPNQLVINKVFSGLRKRFKNPINATVYYHSALHFLDVKPEGDYKVNADAIFFEKASDNNAHFNSRSCSHFCKDPLLINLNSHKGTVANAVKFVAITEEPQYFNQLKEHSVIFILPNYTNNIVVVSMIKLIWTSLQLHALNNVTNVTEDNCRMLRRYFQKKIGAYQNTISEFAIKQMPVREPKTISASA